MAGFLAPLVAGPNADIPENESLRILSLNPQMAGDSTVPTSWTSSSGSLKLSKTIDPDGSIWQRMSASQKSLDAYSCLYQIIPSGNVKPGSTVRISCRARFISQATGSSGIECSASFYGMTKRVVSALVPRYHNTPGAAIPDFGECMFLSEPFVVPNEGHSLITMNIGIFGSGILDVRDFKMFAEGAAVAVDSDFDGMDDIWETNHFGGISQDGEMDRDADGTDNRTEFRLGLDPGNGSSRFGATLSQSRQLRWPSATGVTFAIQRAANPGEEWTTLSIVAGTPSVASYTDPAPPVDRAFYRILCY